MLIMSRSSAERGLLVSKGSEVMPLLVVFTVLSWAAFTVVWVLWGAWLVFTGGFAAAWLVWVLVALGVNLVAGVVLWLGDRQTRKRVLHLKGDVLL